MAAGSDLAFPEVQGLRSLVDAVDQPVHASGSWQSPNPIPSSRTASSGRRGFIDRSGRLTAPVDATARCNGQPTQASSRELHPPQNPRTDILGDSKIALELKYPKNSFTGTVITEGEPDDFDLLRLAATHCVQSKCRAHRNGLPRPVDRRHPQ